MSRLNDNSKLVIYARFGLLLHAFVLTLLILHLGEVLFIPLFFALLVAILLYPLSVTFEKKLRLKKTPSAILSVIIFIAFVGSIILLFTRELIHFFKDLPKVQAKLSLVLQNIQTWISSK